MPTLDDLRAVLIERESFAGDADSARAALDAPHRRHVGPVLAGAAVVVAVAGVAVAMTGSDPARSPVGGGAPSASSTPFTGSAPPATTAPPHQNTALTWAFSVAHVPGYTVNRVAYTPSRQIASVRGADPATTYGSIEVYSAGSLSEDTSSAERVTIAGRPGFVIDDARGMRIAWQYYENSWAEVEGSLSRRAMLDLAAAVRFGTDESVTVPFDLRLPSMFLVEAVAGPDGRDCVGYGTGGPYPEPGAVPTADLGTVLTVCRVKLNEDTSGMHGTNDRFLTQDLGDGTMLEFAVNVHHLDEISQADLVGFAKHADTSPTLDDESTWLPVRS